MSEIVHVDPNRLKPHPRRDDAGPRFDLDSKSLPTKILALKLDILTGGIRSPLLAQAATHFVISGHFRRAVAIDAGIETVPVEFIEVDDETAYEILLRDNWARNDAINGDYIAIARNIRVLMDKYQNEEEEAEDGALTEPMNLPHSTKLDTHGARTRVRRELDLSVTSFKRYVSLLKLIPGLQSMVSRGLIGLYGGCDLAQMSDDAQTEFFFSHHERKEKIADEDIKAFRIMWNNAQTRLADVQAGLDAKKETSVGAELPAITPPPHLAAPEPVEESDAFSLLFGEDEEDLPEFPLVPGEEGYEAQEAASNSPAATTPLSLRPHTQETASSPALGKMMTVPENQCNFQLTKLDVKIRRHIQTADRLLHEFLELWTPEVERTYAEHPHMYAKQPLDEYTNVILQLSRKLMAIRTQLTGGEGDE